MLNYVQITMEEYVERLEGIQVTMDEWIKTVEQQKKQKKQYDFNIDLSYVLNQAKKDKKAKQLATTELKKKNKGPGKKELKQLEAETLKKEDITAIGRYYSLKGERVYYAYTKDYYIVWNTVTYDVPLRRIKDSEQFRRVRNYDFTVAFYSACMDRFPDFCDDLAL